MAFEKFTLSDIRTAVKDKLDDSGFPDTTIDRAANDFQFELFNDNRIRFMEQNETLSVAANSSQKDLPEDFMNLINLIVLDNVSTYRNITKTGFIEYDEFMSRYANFSVATTAKIRDWTFFGEGLRFQSRTDAIYNITLDYLRSPVLMVAATDECELPINNRELMTIGTLERVMRVNEDYPEADAELNRLQGLRTAFIKNYGRGGFKVGPQVVKTNRGRRSGGYRVDRDY